MFCMVIKRKARTRVRDLIRMRDKLEDSLSLFFVVGVLILKVRARVRVTVIMRSAVPGICPVSGREYQVHRFVR